ncbi:MAG: sigma-70 family RNA polymerase sigma factor [Hyphomonadaceae bacterium]|nr:sigma-70 family RNA polymerase sigma factor [Hyphomonadaceae bacterium]
MSIEMTGTDVTERDRLADCVEQIAQSRSRAAFSEIFAYFAPRLKSYLIRLGSEASSAEEIMQEVMLNVWRKAAQYDRRQASVSTWIFRIARNRRIDTLRRLNKPELDAEDPMLRPAEAEQPDVTVNRTQIESQVRGAMESLPEEQLVLLQAAFYDGLSHSEIAKKFDLPLGTVKSRIRLAFLRLRGSLERDQ